MREFVKKTLSFPLLPLLIAAFIPLHLIQTNPAMFSQASQLTRTLFFAGGGSVFLTLVLWLIFRDLHRAGLLAAVLVMILVLGGVPAKRVAGLITDQIGFALPPSLLLFAVFALAILLLRKRKVSPSISRVGNAVTVVLLGYNAVAIALSLPAQPVEPSDFAPKAAAVGPSLFEAAQAPQDPPDILHITLDGYSRADTLEEVYGFDNSRFLSALAELGFTVADGALSPYNQTLLTMSSIFKADYLISAPADENLSAEHYRQNLAGALQTNPVMTKLNDLGYRVMATKTEYPPLALRHSTLANVSLDFALTPLERLLFEFSGMSIIVADLGLTSSVVGSSATKIRDALATSLHERDDHPYFQFVHILAPHPPFDVDGEGRAKPLTGVFNRLADGSHYHKRQPDIMAAYRQGYLEKLAFVNSEILQYLETVISERKRPLVVLLHGDHGGGIHLDQDALSTTCARERYPVLLAVYSSDGKLGQSFDADMNLVNIYRAIFDAYFGTQLEFLPGRNSFASDKKPFHHVPVESHILAATCPPLG